jgi:uncharacterized coiled-coil protein SlyX
MVNGKVQADVEIDESCQSQLKDCEYLGAIADKVISTQNELIETQRQKISVQEEQLQVAFKQIEAVTPRWYERPSFLLPAGIITGIVLTYMMSSLIHK